MSEPIVIQLERGSGLGFNIKGGNDAPVFPGDSSIYVAKVKPDGAAARHGILKEGDKILRVNTTSLENVAHQLAVDTFRTAGDQVEIVVLSGEERRAEQRARSGVSNGHYLTASRLGGGVILLAGAAAMTAFLYYRYAQTQI